MGQKVFCDVFHILRYLVIQLLYILCRFLKTRGTSANMYVCV